MTSSTTLSTDATTVLTGWGRAHRSPSRLVPMTPDADLAELLATTPGTVIPRGCGSGYGDVATNRGGTVIDLTPRSGVLALDVAEGSVVVEAGLELGRLTRLLLPHGWCPPVLPGTPTVSVGGAVAADIHGKNHRAVGSFGEWVQSLVLLTADGRRRRLHPDRDHALFWATVGGLGLTGVITEVTLRLVPVGPGPARSRRHRTGDLGATMAVLDGVTDPVRADHRVHAVAWLDVSSPRLRGLVDVTTLPARHPGRRPTAVLATGRQPMRPPRQRTRPSLPAGVLVARPVVRTAAHLRWSAPARTHRSTGVVEALMPLRRAEAWPRLFGPGGLVQYQLAVPTATEAVLADALHLLESRRVTPALAVLKRLGPADPAALGFALDGWTLALDLPAAAAGLAPALAELDRLVATAGGRVYLAKDVRLPHAAVAAMYPRLEDWRAARDALDPERRFASDLSRRLALTT